MVMRFVLGPPLLPPSSTGGYPSVGTPSGRWSCDHPVDRCRSSVRCRPCPGPLPVGAVHGLMVGRRDDLAESWQFPPRAEAPFVVGYRRQAADVPPAERRSIAPLDRCRCASGRRPPAIRRRGGLAEVTVQARTSGSAGSNRWGPGQQSFVGEAHPARPRWRQPRRRVQTSAATPLRPGRPGSRPCRPAQAQV